MARFVEPTDEQVTVYRKWVQSRPANVRVVAERFEPWSLYRLKTTGDRVTVYSFYEDDTGVVLLTIVVSAEFNFTLFERQVFGIKPDDLEPCELPAEDEITGAMMTQEEVRENLPALREMARRSRKH